MSGSTADNRYPPIGCHGVIGDRQTVALVASDGSIDFWCAPNFDSPTVFAALLDAERGGEFRVAPLGAWTGSQRYLRDTNILITRFVAGSGAVELVDFMPVERQASASKIIRKVTAHAAATVRVRCAPRLDYGRGRGAVTIEGTTALIEGNGARLRLTATVPLAASDDAVVADLTLAAGQRATFVLEQLGDRPGRAPNARETSRLLRRTVVFWRRWVHGVAYRGPWHPQVRRSALVLALLQSRRTGGIVAAPTFGLPEQIGGDRNWDFRYTWIRDASFTMYALARLGLHREGTAFTKWILERCRTAPSPGELQTVYTFDGRRELPEQHLDHLDGYRGSRPVRIGNAAYQQFQLDIYGELIDALYVHDRHGGGTSKVVWDRTAELVNWLAGQWRRPDQGIWEVRSGCQEFLYSRVMCWVAFDRALRIARRRRFPAPVELWRAERDAIRTDLDENFWNDELGAFVGAKGARNIDAAALIMPLVGFIAADDPRWLTTFRAIEARLVRNGLVRRYDMPGMDTDAGADSAPAFTICSFWYVECLARMGRRSEAERVMARLVAHGNDLGLFSENVGPDGKMTGNFPQALPHLALIGAAIAL